MYEDVSQTVGANDVEDGNMSSSTINFIDGRQHSYSINIVSDSQGEQREYLQKQTLLSYNMEFNLITGNKQEKLCYSGQKCHRIPEALVKLYGPKVYTLDLSYNELVTLRGLEGFPLLRELILDNNQLTDSMILPYMPYLHTLSLNKNKIDDIETLLIKVTHNLPALTYLSLLGNKACLNQLSDMANDEEDYQRYRYFVLFHVPKLKFLDSTKVTESERAEAKRRGQLMKIVRPKPSNDIEDTRASPNIHTYTPLPRTIRNPNDHKGVYGKCKYKYSGKHSEGNRFISNNDL